MRDVDADVSTIVVDNDADESAKRIVKELEPRLRWRLIYVVEPRRGITFARNAALEAAHGADLVVFIDDDEQATPGWLRELMAFQRRTGASAVTGPVLPLFDEEPPPWIKRGAFFERPRYPSGTVVQHAGTGNLLLRRSVLSEIGDRPFEETMALTGGEDTLLSMRLREAGHTIVWCDEAVIEEWNPAWRTNASWLIKRAFRGGTTYARSESLVYGSMKRRILRVLKGIIRLCQGIPNALLGGLNFRTDRIVSGAQRAALGMGMVMGAAGLRYEEYGRAARRRRRLSGKGPSFRR